MNELNNQRKNPSREACQKIIKRILVTEVLEKGRNENFRQASDFMNYFQSLYPASDALTKQVQRAIKAMDMPRDEKGYYIVNKTTEQIDQEQEITHLFEKSSSRITSLAECEPILIQADASVRDYLMNMLSQSITFRERFDTIVPSSNGLVLYTREPGRLIPLLESLLPKEI